MSRQPAGSQVRRRRLRGPVGYKVRMFEPEDGAGGADCESDSRAAAARSSASTAIRNAQSSSIDCLSSSSVGGGGGLERKGTLILRAASSVENHDAPITCNRQLQFLSRENVAISQGARRLRGWAPSSVALRSLPRGAGLWRAPHRHCSRDLGL